jgi:hypothetical protein
MSRQRCCSVIIAEGSIMDRWISIWWQHAAQQGAWLQADRPRPGRLERTADLGQPALYLPRSS